MIRKLTGKCPICQENFDLQVDESIIKNADFYPVVFSTIHCNQSLICYIDASFTIRMIETAHIATGTNNLPLPSENDTSPSKSELIPPNQMVYECLLSKEELLKLEFPNLLEKQVVFQIMKHKKISLENLILKLNVVMKALQMDVSINMLELIVKKYVNNKILDRST